MVRVAGTCGSCPRQAGKGRPLAGVCACGRTRRCGGLHRLGGVMGTVAQSRRHSGRSRPVLCGSAGTGRRSSATRWSTGELNAADVWDLLPDDLRRRFDQVASRMSRVMMQLGDGADQVRPHPRRPAPRQCAVLARRRQGHRFRRLRIRLLALRHRRRAVGATTPKRLRAVPGGAHRRLCPASAAAVRRPRPSR